MIENLSFADQISDIFLTDVKIDSSNGLLRNLIESIPSNISIWEGGKVLYANPAFYKSVDITQGDIEALNELVEKEGYFEVHPDDFDYSPENTNSLKNEISSGIVFHKELRMKSRIESDYRWYNTYIIKGNDPNSNVVIEIDEDIHEKKLASEKLLETLKEKEQLVIEKDLLIKEIHHRVKNNFQVISSLLKLKAVRTKDDAVKLILDESCTRIVSMSKIHEMLYQTENLEHINFKDNIKNIVQSLVDLYNGKCRLVYFDINCENIQLTIDTAIPCSLILNELISNSLKYAFKDWKQAKICISLTELESNFVLSVKDNGIGYPDGYESDNTGSLGILIVKTFVTQLNGKIEFISHCGAECKITFPK